MDLHALFPWLPAWLITGSPLPLLGAGALIVLGLVWVAQAGKARRQALWTRQRSLDTLKDMSWRDFERLTAETFHKIGYRVSEKGGRRADGGIDLLIERDGQTFTVQCKHWVRGYVGVTIVREAVGVALHEGVSGAYVVTVLGFTKAARDFARGKPVHLVDGRGLLDLIAKGRGEDFTWRPLAPRPPPPQSYAPAPPPAGQPRKRRW